MYTVNAYKHTHTQYLGLSYTHIHICRLLIHKCIWLKSPSWLPFQFPFLIEIFLIIIIKINKWYNFIIFCRTALNHTTMCPRSSDPFYIVTYYMKRVTTSWTHNMTHTHRVTTLDKMNKNCLVKKRYWNFWKKIVFNNIPFGRFSSNPAIRWH